MLNSFRFLWSRDRSLRHCLAFLVALLAGCEGQDAAKALASAQSSLNAGRYPAAIIELKNALRIDGNQPHARLLLGKALLANAEPTAAAIELDKARSAGVPDDQVLPPLARALLMSRQLQKLLQLDATASGLAPASQAELKSLVASAHALAGHLDAAENELAVALQADPQYLEGRLLRARLLSARGQAAAALEQVRGIRVSHPQDADAATLEGDLLQASGEEKGAQDIYRSVLASEPGHLGASTALIQSLLQHNETAAAAEVLARLKQARPKHLQTLYLDALVAYERGDNDAAYEKSRQLAAAAPENPQALQLAGAAALRVGQVQQALSELTKLVRLAPEFEPGRQLLARAHLRAGHAESAVAALAPLLDDAQASPKTLTLAAQAQLLKGNERAAEQLLARAARAKDGTSQVALALAQVGRGNAEAGLGRLSEIASQDTASTADLALVVARLMKQDLQGALGALDGLERKQPLQPQFMFLRAQVLQRLGDVDGARAQYEAALKRDPHYFAATDALAGLDLKANRPGDARARFEKLVGDKVSGSLALQALAQLDQEAGKPKEEVAAWLQKAVAASPEDMLARRRLVGYHLRNGDHPKALAAAQEAIAAMPDEPAAVETLAVAQFASGQTMQALSNYARLVDMSPKSAEGYLGLAKAYLRAKDTTNAGSAIRKALDVAQYAPEVAQRAAGLWVLAGEHDRALAIARELQTRAPGSAAADELTGDVEASRQRWVPAAAAYRAALAKQPQTRIARQLHEVLRQADTRAAQAFTEQWMRAHPRDVEYLFGVGGTALAAKDFTTAEAMFRAVLKMHPDQPLALNNLAWALAGMNKPEAIGYAERANHLMPNVPALMDTWATLLSQQGRVDAALQVQKKAVELDPGKPTFRLTLARIQIQAGDKSGARQHLEQLRALGDRFEAHQEVLTLLASLPV